MRLVGARAAPVEARQRGASQGRHAGWESAAMADSLAVSGHQPLTEGVLGYRSQR